MKTRTIPFDRTDLSRRHLVQALGAGTAIASLGLWPELACAADPMPARSTLTGTRFDLNIGKLSANFTGTPTQATAVNGQITAPLLRWREGDTVTLRVSNQLTVSSSIHWHGMILPTEMDGVPGLSYPGIPPGGSYLYQFKVQQSGTFWYHSHSRFQEQTGVYGPIVISPRNGERFPSQRDYVVMLSDWTDENPEHVFAKLKKMSDYYNFNVPTVPEFLRDVESMGLQQALAKRRMWNVMRMSPNDLADVSGYTYTYLMNGNAPASNWTGLFSRGDKVRLRFINGSAMTFFDVRIPGLKMTVVAADGQDVDPVSVDEFRIGVAETYDVIVEPGSEGVYTIFAQSMDRTGFARGTLAERAGMLADVPAVDPPEPLAMVDMMGAMAQTANAMPSNNLHGMDHGAMQGMDGMSNTAQAHHARSEYNPGVDMRVDYPRNNLDDPGTGLRENGRKVLVYSDLHTIGGPLDVRDPTREIELHLTGNMHRYMWSFDGQKFADSRPLHLRHGERVRITLVNDTMMAHPIHLHGMWSEVTNVQGEFQVRKHTVVVQPAQRVSYLVNADALGRWAYHCHLLYHMEAGMFREVVVS